MMSDGYYIYAHELDNDIFYIVKYMGPDFNDSSEPKYDKPLLLSCFSSHRDPSLYSKVERWIISIERNKKLNKLF